MDKQGKGRAALAKLSASTPINPLPDVLSDKSWREHAQTLNRQFRSGIHTSLRSRPMPVYPQLQIALERISEELSDAGHVTSNITQADNIRKEAGVPLEQVLDALSEARYATKHAAQVGRITKRDAGGRLLTMPYFFSCLRQKLGLAKRPCTV